MQVQSIKLLPLQQKNKAADCKNKSISQNVPYVLGNLPYNNSYNTAFLGRKDWSDNEKAFFEFKKQFMKRIHKAEKNDSKAEWGFYTDIAQDPEVEKAESALDIYSDKELYQKFLSYKEKGISDPKLKKALDELLQDFERFTKNKKDLKRLNDKENAIETEVDAYRGKVNSKKYTNAKLEEMLATERNPRLLKKIYYARHVINASAVAPDLIKLIKARNKFAKKNGYDNYFSYIVKTNYRIDEKALFELMDDLDEKTAGIFSRMRAKADKELSKVFGVKVEDLKPWHRGLNLKDDPIGEAEKHIKSPESIKKAVLEVFKQMGWDTSKLPITLDLFPRKNKNQHDYCVTIDNKDVRILTNLSSSYESVESLFHELGHGVYSAGISDKLPYDHRGCHNGINEAIAILMESLPYNEDSTVKKLGIPHNLAQKLKIQKLSNDITAVRTALLYINFEKQMYVNPNQDLNLLWHNLAKKYLYRNTRPVLKNLWANIPHFLSSPGYYQNYLRAYLMTPQIYEAARKELGNLTENPETAEFFRSKLFRLGKSLEEDDLIKKFTGKPLSTDAFCREIKEVAKYI